MLNSLFNNFIESDIGLRSWSDHAWVEGVFSLETTTWSCPSWILNNNLLSVEPLQSETENELKTYFELNGDCGVPGNVVWDAMKAVLRGKLISISSFYLKQKRQYKEELLSNIKKLENLHKATCNPEVYKNLLDERRKLDALELNRIQWNILFKNQKYWLQSPRSLKLLAWKVKTKRNSTHVHALKDAAGRQQISTSDILESFRKYYSKLYSTSSPNSTLIRDFLNTHFLGKSLSKAHMDFLEEPVNSRRSPSSYKIVKKQQNARMGWIWS